jgi:hypothetical protein
MRQRFRNGLHAHRSSVRSPAIILGVICMAITGLALAGPAGALSKSQTTPPTPSKHFNATRNAAATSTCPPIEFVGVHGVQEALKSSEQNMGPEVFDTFSRFQQQAQAAGVDVASYGVPYTSITLVQLLKQIRNSFPNVQEGVKLLSDHIQSQKAACPDQREALVGYSEGAWIIDKFLHDASSDLTGRVTAVVLFGDPEFDHTATDFVRLSKDGDGIARTISKFAISPYLPQGLTGRAASYCLSERIGTVHKRTTHDPVCNFTSSKLSDISNCVLKALNAGCVHLHYIKKGVTQRGATFLGGVLLPTSGKKLYVSNATGSVQVFTDLDNLNLQIDTLSTGTGGFEAGMAFDGSSNLYVTDFSNDSVTKFSLGHNPGTTFVSGLPSSPESIVFDGSGNAYVGSADNAAVTKLNSTGQVVDSYSPSPEDRGIDWIDLAKDGCTMVYTSEGTTVQQFNICNKTQLAPLATGLPGSFAYAIRLLPGGGALVADSETIVRLDANGNVLANYDAAGDDQWFSLALDPDGKSFWAGDLTTGDVAHFDILSGTEITHFNMGGAAEGLAVR